MTANDGPELLLRTPAARPCPHPRADHQHGTYAAYQSDRCRCRPCIEANAAYSSHRSRQIAYGRWSAFVDAKAAREHVQDLMRAGLGWRVVARRAALSEITVQRLLYGIRGDLPADRIRRHTAESLLAVSALTQGRGDEQPPLLP